MESRLYTFPAKVRNLGPLLHTDRHRPTHQAEFSKALTDAASNVIPLTLTDHWYYNDRVAELHHPVHITKRNMLKFPSNNNLVLYRDTLRQIKKEREIRTQNWLAW